MHQAERLLNALGHDKVTFQTFPDHPRAPGRPTILHGRHGILANRLATLNAAGNGIFFMVNHGDQQGRRTENVTSVTAYFVDLDGTPLYDLWPLPPTAITESSPGRYHAYWRVMDAPLNTFTHTQKHIALLLAGDEKCVDLPRVLRLPGYQHQKSEPFTTRVIHTDPSATYTYAQVQTSFAVPPLPPKREYLPLPPAAQAYVDRHQRAKHRGRTLDTAAARIATAKEGNRNHTLYRVAAAVANQVKAGEIDRREAEHTLVIAAGTAGLDEHEATSTVKSALRHA